MLARLFKFKSGPTPDVAAQYEMEGDLAESVEIPADGLTVTHPPTAPSHPPAACSCCERQHSCQLTH
ncbi:MAG: hypothetical protein ACRDJE_00160 [Dehalococcoidia bacterium]